MTLHIHPQPTDAIHALADFFISTANSAIEKKGRAALVLSGGSSPKQLYELLTTTAYRSQTQWNKLFFFIGDERYVPATDNAYNGNMIKKTLFEPLNIKAEQVFYVDTSLKPSEAASDYAHKIKAFFGNEPWAFDLILLGLGDNMHTASLFPHTDVLSEKTATIKAVFVEELEAYRITMTAPLINQAAAIAFLVFGSGKAAAVKAILSGERDSDQYPAQLINPETGNLNWFLDTDAAALI